MAVPVEFFFFTPADGSIVFLPFMFWSYLGKSLLDLGRYGNIFQYLISLPSLKRIHTIIN